MSAQRVCVQLRGMGVRNRLESLGLVSPQIFISYRRTDAGGYAGRLVDALSGFYGDRAMFLDHTGIRGGDEFADELDEALGEAEVVLVVIGPDWLDAEKNGKRRLDDPDDWVRREVATSLDRRGVRVIPVLVGGAELPAADDLPDPLKPLVARQVHTLRPDRFDDDVTHLRKSIGGWHRRWLGVPVYAWGLGAVTAVALALFALFAVQGDVNLPPTIRVPGAVSAVSGNEVEIDILAWAEDDSSDELRLIVEPVSEENGTVTDLENGRVIYSAARGFHGTDRFGFQVVDEDGVVSSGTAVIDVGLGPMEGSFNVAVAEFATTGDGDDTTARTLSASVHDQVQKTLQDSAALGLEVAAPETLGTIEGDTAAERAEQARLLAEQVNAHVVLYGTLDLGDGVSRLTPEMYLSPTGLTEAGELSGAYELGTLERGTTDPIALTIAATEFLEPKVAALAPLFVGLAHYQLNDYVTAEELFIEAEEGWPAAAAVSGEGNGREGVLNLLGAVAGLQNRLDEARDYYTAALSIDPDFARSRFGIAEVQFQQARGPKCADTEVPEDISLLEDAIQQFREVAELEAPPLSFLPARAQLEVGRILLCMVRYDVDSLGDARVQIETVIAENGTNERLRDLVAEAHAMLAFRQILKNEHEAAIDEFRSAIDLTLNDAKKAFYHSAIGDLLICSLDEPELADREYQIAESLLDPRPLRSDCSGGLI